MSYDEEWWWWASRKGDLKTVDGQELRDNLGKGVLTPDTLIWKDGWAGWLQAAEIAELASALPPGKARTPVAPGLDESATSPPSPPLERYAAKAPAAKRTLLGLPKAGGAAPPRPGGPPRPAASPLRPGGSRPPPKPTGGRTPGAPPRPLSGSKTAERPPPPRRPSTRPPAKPHRPSTRPPPPPRRGARPHTAGASTPEEEILVEIDAELEDVETAVPPAAKVPALGDEKPAKPEATRPDATLPDAAPPPEAVARQEASAKPDNDTGVSSVRPSRIISVGSGGDAKQAVKAPEPIVPVASNPDNDAPTQVTAPGAELDPIVPVPSDPENELPTILMAPVSEGKEPIVPVPSDPENELPTRILDKLPSDVESELPTQIKLDMPDSAPLPSWSDELDRDSVPGTAMPAAPLPAFPTSDTDLHRPGADPLADDEQLLEAAFSGRGPGAKRRVAIVLGVVGSAVVLLLIAGVVSLFRSGGPSSADKSASAGSSAPATAHSAKGGATAGSAAVARSGSSKAPSHAACTLGKPGTRFAEKTAVRVPPYLATAPGAAVALGFATTPTAAIGVTVDPASLDLTEEFSRDGQRNVLGVVPLVRGTKLDFAVDRDGSPLSYAHTIDASPPFLLGLAKGGVSRAIGYGEPETIWPGAGDERITEPRVISVDGVGHAVTFRRGGREGEVRVGWLTPDGSKKTDLVAIKADGPRVGTPNIAANDREVLVAFAGRPSDDAAWAVRLARAPLGKAPDSSESLDLPGGGPGGDAISPAAVGLPGGRWLVQWTEGKAGSRAVRAQTFGTDLTPIGKPITLSPDGRDSGQGALWLVGTHALSVFLVRSDSGYELWGAGLSCP